MLCNFGSTYFIDAYNMTPNVTILLFDVGRGQCVTLRLVFIFRKNGIEKWFSVASIKRIRVQKHFYCHEPRMNDSRISSLCASNSKLVNKLCVILVIVKRFVTLNSVQNEK